MSQDHRHLAEAARQVYGSDPQGYQSGRPEYPAAVYEMLASRCGLGHGSRVLEVGPGTGLVTRHLLEAGASVVAVEPDASRIECHPGKSATSLDRGSSS